MKKLTAMLLSLVMCFSLLAIPAQAAFIPEPDGPVIIVGGDPTEPGDKDPDEPENPVQPMSLPDPTDRMPIDN